MGESPTSALPQLEGLAIEAVEWLPSGADSGLVRVRGRWTSPERARPGLPELGVRAPGGAEQRFESLPDARFARDPASWRGSYLVPAALVAAGPAALWVEWPGGVRSGLPPLAPALADVPLAPEPPAVEEPVGGEVIDRAVLAERRARRAEASEQAQARVAAEALKAVEALELQSAELERRLAERGPAPEPSRDAELARVAERRAAALGSALDSLARLRAQSRDWRLRLRTGEIAHAGDAVRLAVLEAERASAGDALRAALHERAVELEEARRVAESRAGALADATAEAASLRAQLADLRAEAEASLDAVEQRARGERAVHAEVRDALSERLQAETARARALDAAHAAERAARLSADTQLAELRVRAEELEAALERTETKLLTAAAEAAAAEARLRVESVARGALEDELDRDRAANAGAHELATQLAAATEESTRLRTAIEAERAARAAAIEESGRLQAAIEAERSARAAEAEAAREESTRFAAGIDAERTARAAATEESGRLQAAIDAERTARAAAIEESGRLQAAIDAERTARNAAIEESGRLQAAIDAERSARAAAVEAAVQAERVAGAAAVEAERAARAAERDALIVQRDEVAGAASADLIAQLAAERERRATAEAARSAFEADLEAARAELAAVRAELEAAHEGGATLLDRIAELDRTASGLANEARLERVAREQAEAAAAAARRPAEESGRMLADLDAAATALREAAPLPDTEAEAPAEPETVVEVEAPAEPEAVQVEAEAPAEPEAPVEVAAPAEPEVVADAEVEAPEEPEVPAAAPPRPRPTIVSASGPPPRVDATGRSARDYPPLRGAIVKLAHDDPATAGRVIAALLPAQAAALSDPLDYDITIKETGTFAVTVAGTWTHVKPLDEPRPRGEADFHLTADALTLAELLAGVPRRVGRMFGPARVRGSARRAKLLKALARADLSVSETVRAGATLDAGLVYRALAYAVHPSWTRGEHFTVAQQITGGETWYLTARDGAGLAVSQQPPEEGVDATVEMTKQAFRALLRGERPPRGERPTIRGDRRAVALMKAWTDRAQGS